MNAEKKVPAEKEIESASEMFSLLGAPSRLRILYCLMQGSQTVGEIATAVGMTESATSHQLRLLRSSRLVKNAKEGRNVFYSLDDEHVSMLLTQIIEHLSENHE